MILAAAELFIHVYYLLGCVCVYVCVCVLVAQPCLTLCNPMDCSPPGFPVHGILQVRTLEWVAMPFSNLLQVISFHLLEKEMATHSSILAWRIPGTGEPGGLPSMGSHRVGHD